MDVQLTPELEQIVQEKVKSGRYNSATEVVRDALHLLEERDQIKAEVRMKIEAGLESLRRGKGIDGDAFFDQLEAEIDEDIRLEEEQAELERVGSR